MTDAETAGGRILVEDSATKLDDHHRGQVVVAGSHGGLYPAWLAAKAGVRGVVLCDAGVGKEGAGVAGLALLAACDIPAVTVSHLSARIADGRDQLARGVVSHVNQPAAQLGCAPGDRCRECCERMRDATMPRHAPRQAFAETRHLLRAQPGEPEVWGLDSAALMRDEDHGRIIVTGSHGGLLGGREDGIVRGPPLGVTFCDAGVGIERAGIGRLAALDARGIPAAAVAVESARIGDARSQWETGRLSHVNGPAARRGVTVGDDLVALVERLAAAG